MENNLTVNIPINFKTWGGRKIILSPKGNDLRKLDESLRRDEKLIKALARAFKWKEMLLQGKTIEQISAKEKIQHPFILRTVRMTLLSPKIIEAIINGKQPEGFSLKQIEKQPIPKNWNEQAKLYGFDNCHY